MVTIAHIRNDFSSKFGVPRQSGLVASESIIEFEPAFRNANAVRGLEGFSHIWLLWQFSEVQSDEWQPTVRPPRLGGNQRMGVFATRSPFRPNNIGLSCVTLLGIDDGPALRVGGADLIDGTPIIDIKPYVAFCDAHPEARSGFVDSVAWASSLKVCISPEVERLYSPAQLETLRQMIAADQRPAYQRGDDRVYILPFGRHELRFSVTTDGVATVTLP